MKVIDLITKIANGEEVPNKIRINHWYYKFEWVEHDSNYYDKNADIDLMSCLSMDKEELNYGVHELKEDKEIEEVKALVEMKDMLKAENTKLKQKLQEQQNEIYQLERNCDVFNEQMNDAVERTVELNEKIKDLKEVLNELGLGE